MRRFWKIIILLNLLGTQYSYAQDSKPYTLVGTVLDSNGSPIIGVTIIDIKNNRGATTNEKGTFYLNLDTSYSVIQLSHIGYITIRERIVKQFLNGVQLDTIKLFFRLENSVEKLPEVNISTNIFQLAYAKRGASIVDYQFYEEYIVLILKENDSYHLRMIDALDKTIYNVGIRKKPKGIVKDCNDEFYLQYADSSYQIIITNGGFSVGERFSYQEHLKALSICMTSIDNKLFLRQYESHNQAVIYWSYDQITEDKTMIQAIVDEENIRAINDYQSQIDKRQAMLGDVNRMGGNSYLVQRELRRIERDVYHMEQVDKQVSYHPLFQIRDSIAIFNHLVDSAYVYNKEGNFQRTFPIFYTEHKDWSEENIVDLEKKNVYAVLERNGFVTLQHIDWNTGNPLKSHKIIQHSFPDLIKVKDDYVYYIYQDPYQVGSLKKLYKQPLN